MATFIPPPNFGTIEEGLFRSGEPNETNFPFLEKLGLTKVIYLAPDDPSRAFVSFCDDAGIELIHLGREQHKTPWKPVSEDVVLHTLAHILNPASYPLAIMCHLGRHRTGTAVGCLRKLQRWSMSAIFEEYRRFAGQKVRLMNEQFIELFDTDLVRIPAKSPKCLSLS